MNEEIRFVHSGNLRYQHQQTYQQHQHHHMAHIPPPLNYYYHSLPYRSFSRYRPRPGTSHQIGLGGPGQSMTMRPVSSQFHQRPEGHFKVISNAVYDRPRNAACGGGMTSNVLQTTPSQTAATHTEGSCQPIPVIEGIPRQTCEQINENSTHEPSTNSTFLVCLTPTVANAKDHTMHCKTDHLNCSKEQQAAKCRVDITTLPGWSSPATKQKTSLRKRHNLKKIWTNRYHESKRMRNGVDHPGNLESFNETILKELEEVRVAHDNLKQRVSLQKRQHKVMRRELDLLSAMIRTELLPSCQSSRP
ncbi:uncharacterized protein [Antedon mediterranea]|uniref:uncharacterized protein n=1 Tax=Antedon mediterranea TaxID=105859 RepID=UPI003AF464C9